MCSYNPLRVTADLRWADFLDEFGETKGTLRAGRSRAESRGIRKGSRRGLHVSTPGMRFALQARRDFAAFGLFVPPRSDAASPATFAVSLERP